jgi:tryptophan 2,3-dioxygenase
MRNIATDELNAAFKQLARVSKIMEQLVHAWDVLATMTPPEYSAIRPYLGHSSGFQSFQYRCIEFAMGNKNAAMLKPHAHHPERAAMVQAAYEAPSLYDEALRLLARRGITVPASHLERDWTQPYQASDAVEQAWLQVYRDPKQHWDLYQLGEELTDLEDAFRLWRFRHVTTVERVIGFKRGTGGTGGVSYLRKMLDVVLFPSLRSGDAHGPAHTGPAAWRGPDFDGDTRWIHHLTPDHIALFDTALTQLKALGLRYPDFGRDDFPIHALAPELARFADELENGRGFLLLRGLPVERYSEEDLNALYYGLGLHMGTPVRQNPRGDLLGAVMNVGDVEEGHPCLRNQPLPALPLGSIRRGGPAVRAQGHARRPEQPGQRGGDPQ